MNPIEKLEQFILDSAKLHSPEENHEEQRIRVETYEELRIICDALNSLQSKGYVHSSEPFGDTLYKSYQNNYHIPMMIWFTKFSSGRISLSHQGVERPNKNPFEESSWIEPLYLDYWKKALPFEAVVNPEEHPEYFI
jgi:hypothetical protein